jgi:hypothetical protein
MAAVCPSETLGCLYEITAIFQKAVIYKEEQFFKISTTFGHNVNWQRE